MIADQATALRGMVSTAEIQSDRVGSFGTIQPDEPPSSNATAQALRHSQHAAVPEPAFRFARALAVTSGKGGVGKTTLSVNLAIQLSLLGRRVLLLDADLGTANADVLCDVSPAHTLAHVVAGRCSLEEIIVQGPGGFQLIPGASGLAQMANLNESERLDLMRQMRRIEDQVDLILIDTGAGVGPNVLSFAMAADEVLVVTTPEPTAITDAYAIIKTMSRQKAGPAIRVLVNMANHESEAKAVFGRISAVSQRFLNIAPRYAGYIPLDSRVPTSVRRRKPFVLEHPSSPAGTSMNELAHRLDRHAAQPPTSGLLKRMIAWMGK